jgi:hypothetical protein
VLINIKKRAVQFKTNNTIQICCEKIISIETTGEMKNGSGSAHKIAVTF